MSEPADKRVPRKQQRFPFPFVAGRAENKRAVVNCANSCVAVLLVVATGASRVEKIGFRRTGRVFGISGLPTIRQGEPEEH